MDKQVTYTAKLEPHAIDDYIEFFASLGVPNDKKLGVVFDIVHAYPFINDNHHGFTAEVLRKSYKSFVTSLIDINHDKSSITGSIVRADLIESNQSPVGIRLAAVLDKEILALWGIDDVAQEDWSMECVFKPYVYNIGNKFYEPGDIPDIDAQYNDIALGKAVYDTVGNRVNLLMGGHDGVVNFHRCGLIVGYERGADPLAQTHLQVANKQNGGNGGLEYTDEQIKELTEKAKNEGYASRQSEVDEWKGKHDTVCADNATLKQQYEAEKGRADQAEASLNEKVQNEQFEQRKQLLASKNLTYRPEKEAFIKASSAEDFDNFVADLEFVSKQKEVVASVQHPESTLPVKLSVEGTELELDLNALI